MIQRIQSVYLLIVTVLFAVLYIFPLAIFGTEGSTISLNTCHLIKGVDIQYNISLIPLAILPSVISLLSFVTVFLYKNRTRQMKIGKINIFLILIYLGVFVFYFIKIQNDTGLSGSPEFIAVLPVIALSLIVFANKAIKKDDDLVKSVDRIR